MPATISGSHLGLDTHANRPAANAAGQPFGALYSCSTHSLIYKTDGSSWATYATLGSAGGDVSTDAIWTTAGKVAVATGTATATEQWPPGYQFDYVAKTTNTSVTATTEGTANTVITGSSVAYDGSTVVRIEFFACSVQPDSAAAARYIQFVLLEDSTVIGLPAFLRTPAAASMNAPINFAVHRTPSNASHTYTVQAYVNAGTGTVSAGSGGTGANVAAFIRVVKV